MDQSIQPVGRRTVLRGTLLAGGGLAALPVIAACGDDAASDAASDAANDAASEAGDAASEAGDAASEAVSDALAPVSDVAVGSAVIFKEQEVVVSQPKDGDFKAFSAICTHQGCTVGSVEGEEIVCPCHGSRFSITDGSVTNGPATQPLEEASVSVDGDQLVLG